MQPSTNPSNNKTPLAGAREPSKGLIDCGRDVRDFCVKRLRWVGKLCLGVIGTPVWLVSKIPQLWRAPIKATKAVCGAVATRARDCGAGVKAFGEELKQRKIERLEAKVSDHGQRETEILEQLKDKALGTKAKELFGLAQVGAKGLLVKAVEASERQSEALTGLDSKGAAIDALSDKRILLFIDSYANKFHAQALKAIEKAYAGMSQEEIAAPELPERVKQQLEKASAQLKALTGAAEKRLHAKLASKFAIGEVIAETQALTTAYLNEQTDELIKTFATHLRHLHQDTANGEAPRSPAQEKALTRAIKDSLYHMRVTVGELRRFAKGEGAKAPPPAEAKKPKIIEDNARLKASLQEIRDGVKAKLSKAEKGTAKTQAAEPAASGADSRSQAAGQSGAGTSGQSQSSGAGSEPNQAGAVLPLPYTPPAAEPDSKPATESKPTEQPKAETASAEAAKKKVTGKVTFKSLKEAVNQDTATLKAVKEAEGFLKRVTRAEQWALKDLENLSDDHRKSAEKSRKILRHEVLNEVAKVVEDPNNTDRAGAIGRVIATFSESRSESIRKEFGVKVNYAEPVKVSRPKRPSLKEQVENLTKLVAEQQEKIVQLEAENADLKAKLGAAAAAAQGSSDPIDLSGLDAVTGQGAAN